MFDWNDDELANIIWGEAAESDDHIVPYPKASEHLRNKKEWNQGAATAKLTEQKLPEDKFDMHGQKHWGSSNLDTKGGISASGSGMDSWADLSVFNAVKTDQYSMDTEVSNNLSEISKYGSSRAETADLVKDAELYQSTTEDKEQSDFVDYSWTDVGSFDDLDRILSNDDPVFGHVSLDNADELWSSSKGMGRLTGPTSHGLQNLHTITDLSKYAEGRSQPTGKRKFQTNRYMVGKAPSVNSSLTAENRETSNDVSAKVSRQKNLLKSRKKLEGKHEGNMSRGFYGSWSPSVSLSRQFENHVVPSGIQSSPSSIVRQQRQLQGAGSLQYQNISNSFVGPCVYGNLTSTYPSMPVLSHIHSGELRQQPLLSGYEVSPGKTSPVKKPVDSPVNPLTMTPLEKIEKLRRRQQMQAMLAIQKQQQQFGQQVSSANKTVAQKSPKENQIFIDGSDLEVENLSTLPAIDPNSPTEQDDSHTISVAVDDYFVEDTVLYRLQDIISKLDIKIRLCIRDSLFRLAQSAMQRRYDSNTRSANKSSRDEIELVAKEESNKHERYTGLPDGETETNAIDRAVAHLLFNRPLELPGNHPETLDLPFATQIQCMRNSADQVNLPIGCMPGDSESKQHFSHQGFKSSSSLAEVQPVDQCKNSPEIDTSENASNNEPANVGAQEVEASQ
ncbi:protein LNK2-like isoform X1 [Quillaja saponaria]|uniref:Protein LNK2-like isoform X1 n=1 Tax=Quillaja saponaria TaxID=32244 RepID=A0AAD7QJC3_QUISA|nr:protein LNK2-like isoform X1 [Quillaja saponaria]